MSKIKFELCPHSKKEQLLQFIKEHWSNKHIFLANKELFDWQHRTLQGYNFVLATSTEGDILGILGFIPTWQFSSMLHSHKEIWLAIWKVRNDINQPGIGLGLLNFLKREFNKVTICSVGLTKEVVPMYKALKYNVGKLKHKVLVNDSFKQYEILSKGQYSNNVDSIKKTSIDELKLLSESNIRTLVLQKELFVTKPQKNIDYVVNRYLKHPVYHYDVYALVSSGETLALLVTRKIKVFDKLIIRVIDYQGSDKYFSELSYHLFELINACQAEYIDLIQHGLSDDVTHRAGFVDVDEVEGMIVPHHFEPFEKKNIAIDFAYKSESGNLCIFKGDSDLDRPSITY